MDTNGQISVLQNQQLLTSLESIQFQCDEYKNKNLKLKEKIKELKNEIAMHKKIEINLTLKLKEKTDKEKINKTLEATQINQNSTSPTNYNPSENKSNSISPPPILDNSNNKSISIKNLKCNTLTKNKKKNLKLLMSNSLSSSDNDIENYFRKDNKDFNYKKYKKKIKEKDEKIELLELQVDKLNQKINSYFMKYKGLFNYIEYCINEFYNDEKLMSINSSMSLENIKKFEFSSLDKKDQYSILIILMNYLMKVFNFNYPQKNTDKDPPIFATNLKYINTNFNYTKHNFNHLYIKNPFINRNKIMNTFNSYRMNNKLNFSISALNENSSTNDYRIFDNKYKTLI